MLKNVHPVSSAGIRTHDLLNTKCQVTIFTLSVKLTIYKTYDSVLFSFIKNRAKPGLFCLFSTFLNTMTNRVRSLTK